MRLEHDRRLWVTALAAVALVLVGAVAASCLPVAARGPSLPPVVTTQTALPPAPSPSIVASATTATTGTSSTPAATSAPAASGTTSPAGAKPAKERSHEDTDEEREVIQPGVREQSRRDIVAPVAGSAEAARNARRHGARTATPAKSRRPLGTGAASSRRMAHEREEDRCGYFSSKTKTASRRSSQRD